MRIIPSYKRVNYEQETTEATCCTEGKTNKRRVDLLLLKPLSEVRLSLEENSEKATQKVRRRYDEVRICAGKSYKQLVCQSIACS